MAPNLNGRILNRAQLEAAYVTYSAMFDMALQNTPVIYPELATVMPGVGPVTEFRWLGDMPVMVEWNGNRKINRLRAEAHSLRTRWYANGIEVDHDDVAEDKLGVVRPRIEGLAQMAPRKLDALVIDYLVAGFGATLGSCWDGQYLFDDDHVAGTGAGQPEQSNIVEGALASDPFNDGIQAMMEFVGENGEPLQVIPDTLLVGPANQLVARQLLLIQYGTGGAQNVDYQRARLIINSRIVGDAADNWFLLSLQQRIRAIMLGIEFAPEFAQLMGFDQQAYFMNRTGYAGAHMKVGLTYGMWQVAVGSTGA